MRHQLLALPALSCALGVVLPAAAYAADGGCTRTPDQRTRVIIAPVRAPEQTNLAPERLTVATPTLTLAMGFGAVPSRFDGRYIPSIPRAVAEGKPVLLTALEKALPAEVYKEITCADWVMTWKIDGLQETVSQRRVVNDDGQKVTIEGLDYGLSATFTMLRVGQKSLFPQASYSVRVPSRFEDPDLGHEYVDSAGLLAGVAPETENRWAHITSLPDKAASDLAALDTVLRVCDAGMPPDMITLAKCELRYRGLQAAAMMRKEFEDAKAYELTSPATPAVPEEKIPRHFGMAIGRTDGVRLNQTFVLQSRRPDKPDDKSDEKDPYEDVGYGFIVKRGAGRTKDGNDGSTMRMVAGEELGAGPWRAREYGLWGVSVSGGAGYLPLKITDLARGNDAGVTITDRRWLGMSTMRFNVDLSNALGILGTHWTNRVYYGQPSSVARYTLLQSGIDQHIHIAERIWATVGIVAQWGWSSVRVDDLEPNYKEPKVPNPLNQDWAVSITNGSAIALGMQFRPHQRFGMAGGIQYQYFQQSMSRFVNAAGGVYEFVDTDGANWEMKPGGVAIEGVLFYYL